MGVKYLDDGRIQDLNFTITITGKCNLSCNYCPLINQNKVISFETLDNIIFFFNDNIEFFEKYTKNIVFIFFGGEPLLNIEQIKYFLEKMFYYNVKTKYVIYTNGIRINQFLLTYIKKYNNFSKRIIFYISFDGNKNNMLKNRLLSEKQFFIIKENIRLLKENGFQFSFSKVLYEKDSKEIFNALKYLDNFGPNKLDFLPVSFDFDGGYNNSNIKEVIKGIDLFINYLLIKGMTELSIMEYLGLPDTLEGFKELYKVDYGIFADYNGDFYGIIDAMSIFNTKNTFLKSELDNIILGNINNKSEFLLRIIEDYKNFENKMFQIGNIWNERNFTDEIKAFSLISMYFIKKLLIYKYKPQD